MSAIVKRFHSHIWLSLYVYMLRTKLEVHARMLHVSDLVPEEEADAEASVKLTTPAKITRKMPGHY